MDGWNPFAQTALKETQTEHDTAHSTEESRAAMVDVMQTLFAADCYSISAAYWKRVMALVR